MDIAKVKQYEPYIPTAEEKEKLLSEMEVLLDKYDYEWTKDSLMRIIETFFKQKGRLISMFQTHPSYNGNYQIVFSDETYMSETNRHAGVEFESWIYRNFCLSSLLEEKKILGKTYEECCDLRTSYIADMPQVQPVVEGDTLHLINYELYLKYRQKADMVTFILNAFNGNRYTNESIKKQEVCGKLLNIIARHTEARVSQSTAGKFNALLPELRVRKGQKITKVVGKIMAYYGIDELPGYHKAYARYCDEINVIKIKRHTVLSLNPLDYLTMSFGNSWSSCHTIDKENLRNSDGETYHGAYSSGTVSYMLDETSFVLYTVSSSYDGESFWEQDKINRCMFHLGKERLVQGRCYPQAEDGNDDLYTQFRTLVQRTVAEMLEVPNLWTLKRDGLRNDIVHNGTNYPDYYHFGQCNISTYKFADNATEKVRIGAKPICIECGCTHNTEDNISCCANGSCCDCCENYEDRDNMHYIDGEWYCNDCCFYCEYHERYERHPEDAIYVERHGYICEDAYHSGDYFICAECGYVFYVDNYNETSERDGVCNNCADNYYVYIDSVGMYYRENDVIYCKCCGTPILNERATETEDGDVCPYCLEHYYHENENGEYVRNERQTD